MPQVGEFLARVQVEDLDRGIAANRQLSAVGVEGEVLGRRRRALHPWELCIRNQVNEPNRAVRTPNGGLPAVGAEAHAGDAGWLFQYQDRLGPAHVPDLHSVVWHVDDRNEPAVTA